MANKTFDYYWSLDYPAEIRKSVESGGYFAFHPDLEGCMAEGGTADETLENLADSRALWIEARLESGFPVPEPTSDEPSGRISLRMMPSLHAGLVTLAARRGVSLNLLINTVLSEYLGGATGKEELERARESLEKAAAELVRHAASKPLEPRLLRSSTRHR